MHLRSWVAGPVLICVLLGALLHGDEAPIMIGVVMDGSTPQERMPLQSYLTKAMGRPVKVVSPDTYGDAVAELADGYYDFACLGALVYIRARAKYGVVPLVQRVTDLAYHTVFITGANSSIRSLQDLRGRRFAFGDIDSTSGHLMAAYELIQAGINPETDIRFRYSGSHPATAALVAQGVVDAGAIDATVFNFLIASGKVDQRKIRVFYTSKPYVDYVWVARKDLPRAEQEKFSHALLALRQGSDDAILKVLRARHFVVASDDEYKSMRQIARELKMF
jgi:phosphonate transport system substrate-binding protein